MKKYDPDEKCQKCGNGDFDLKYFSTEIPILRLTPFEGIRRTCKKCGFEKDFEPLDAHETPEGDI